MLTLAQTPQTPTSNGASSRKWGSVKPDRFTTGTILSLLRGFWLPSGRLSDKFCFGIYQYKWFNAEEARLFARREGLYQLLWYMHISGTSGRFRRPWGVALVNERCLFVVRLEDGTLLVQGQDDKRRAYSIEELDADDTFWTEFGEDLRSGRVLANLLVATREANLAIIRGETTPPEPETLVPGVVKGPQLSDDPEQAAQTMRLKTEHGTLTDNLEKNFKDRAKRKAQRDARRQDRHGDTDQSSRSDAGAGQGRKRRGGDEGGGGTRGRRQRGGQHAQPAEQGKWHVRFSRSDAVQDLLARRPHRRQPRLRATRWRRKRRRRLATPQTPRPP